MADANKQLIERLQKDILQWEGYKAPASGRRETLGLGPLEAGFPNGVFPKSTVHELVCADREQAAASGGFVTGVLSLLMQEGGICVWIGRRRLFAPALAAFGVAPHRVIFINLGKDKDALWVMEEALKCGGLTAVVCELKDMDFKQSQRFQRAVEQSRVTGFVLRNAKAKLSSTACAARWQISALPSTDLGALPGLGFLRWQVDLLKVRNGQTGSYVLEWQDQHFVPVEEDVFVAERQVG
ncbi:ImuA family protein [Mucilaginibacter boryungensis]|uniref:Error-prone repair protein ImuA n=1 Tax=Mucilaginibacter boryungensis TaxID=768480 RepID=A0ABR9XEF2_9SPHI|nr:Error-prone repair protein ImuA [Mucilaginibacter boryungensis]MBE9665428.1 Error-prone repair protein ImuA [Mucilaginibacter boryungensis]